MVHLIAGGIMHETHTFSAEPTLLESFTLSRGDDCASFANTNHSMGGVVDACRDLGIQLSFSSLRGRKSTSPVTTDVFDTIVGDLLDGIEKQLPADGVVLTLHGAMVAEGHPEADAEIVRRVRALMGPDVPIAVTLDLHANIGQSLVDAATIIVGYDTYPHIDASERAQEAVHLLVRTINGELNPVMALVKPPILAVPQAMFTSEHPFKTIFDHAFAMEREGRALTITVSGGFAYADAPATGMSILVTTDGDHDAARSMANELAELAWELRDDMRITNTAPEDAVAEAIAYPDGTVILVDVGDNIGGGTPGDGTVLLSELLRQGSRDAVMVIADAEAVQDAFAAGVGGTVNTRVGGKTDDRHGRPVDISGRVRLLTDGHWVHEGPENAGVPVDSGPTAVVDVNDVTLILNSRKTGPGDQQQLRSVGIDPLRQKIIVMKAAVRWRGGFGPIARHAIHVDTPGLGDVDLSQFEFHHLSRPIHPLDQIDHWEGGSIK